MGWGQPSLESVGLRVRVLVTGHNGYIGSRLVPLFSSAGHEVIGLDSYLFEACTFGDDSVDAATVIRKDVRDVDVADLGTIDAVVHLAGISNDPLGNLNPHYTFDINHQGTIHLARVAKAAGVHRFAFASSCSLYGAHGDDVIDEEAEFKPATPYGESKVLAEHDLAGLADDDFSPTYLRNATAYGVSARLRGDLVVNNLTAYATTTSEVLMKSDGSPWRPLVHIEDIARAFLAVVEAPRERVHDVAFNVGSTSENYQIRDVARIVEEEIPGSRIVFAEGASPDIRNYRVSCERLAQAFPDFAPRWTVRDGVRELRDAFERHGLDLEQLTGNLQRVHFVNSLMQRGQLNPDLRWTTSAMRANG